MAAFTHCDLACPSRFSDGTYGVYNAADGFGTAIREVAHHMGRFYAWRRPAGSADHLGYDLRDTAKTYDKKELQTRADRVGIWRAWPD